jgi:hypothetical protein
MNSLSIKIKPKLNHSQNVLIELNADKFERLAANFGFFNQEFLESLENAEKDYKKGKMKKIKSLKELR